MQVYGHVAKQRFTPSIWCETGQCYVAREECTCKFCGFAGVDKCHLLTCEWACSIPFNRDNIQQIVEVMQACNRHTYMYVYYMQLYII